MLTATEEIALLRARHLQALLPEMIKGSIWIHVDFDTIIVQITTRELGTFSECFKFNVNTTASDLARIIVRDYKERVLNLFFK